MQWMDKILNFLCYDKLSVEPDLFLFCEHIPSPWMSGIMAKKAAQSLSREAPKTIFVKDEKISRISRINERAARESKVSDRLQSFV